MLINNFFKNKTVNVVAEKIVFPGRSLCRCVDGVTLFTDGLLPKETAEVFVTKDKKTFREGLVKSITLASDERINPICTSFGLCGGCSFQNVSYETQIKYKYEYTSELLSFIGVEIPKILINLKIWHYRNKMEFSFFNGSDFKHQNQYDFQMSLSSVHLRSKFYCAKDVRNDISKKGIVDVGLHHRGSFNKYVSVPPCLISDKSFSPVVEIVKKFTNKNNLTIYNNTMHKGFFRHLVLRKAENNNQLLVNIVTNSVDCAPEFLIRLVSKLSEFSNSVYWTINGAKSDAILFDKLTLMHGKAFITEKLDVGNREYFFNISPFSFFQTSSKGAEILYNEILGMLDPLKNDILLDLYCGIGVIGILMAESFKRVIGIERSKQSIEDAKENALINNICNIEFLALSVEDWVKENGTNFNAVVVDPPRSGLIRNVINFLIKSRAKKIIYVSCNPSTLARDLKLIIENSKYTVKKIRLIDMFPQTYHIEVIVLLEL
ncbi:MAG: 23S rRNA (uracil(1939)-C(5))-methyltransferase RlmD [Endomicrobium sp.]|jgi:23S rRNA (uracil-5-)-methyltransferase RumA|nr:23S rRNA (uracil(1939)-C(5))-methyltransferase RlmD [Endomicrobium sp.]